MRRFNFKSAVVVLCLSVSGNLFATACVNEPSNYSERSPLLCDVAIDAGDDVTVYLGYDPMECVDLSATVTNGVSPFQILWSTGSTDDGIQVCPVTTTTYYVEVSDGNECYALDSVTVTVIDVRCGRSNEKVLVCHNGNTICIDEHAVPTHLNHGCTLGECGSGLLYDLKKSETVLEENNTSLSIYPNPAINRLYVNVPSYHTGDIYFIVDLQGKIVISDTFKSEKNSIDIEELPSGMYILRTSSGELIKWNKQ